LISCVWAKSRVFVFLFVQTPRANFFYIILVSKRTGGYIIHNLSRSGSTGRWRAGTPTLPRARSRWGAHPSPRARSRGLVVAVQVAFEKQGLRPGFHYGSRGRLKVGNQALSSYGSTGFNLSQPHLVSCPSLRSATRSWRCARTGTARVSRAAPPPSPSRQSPAAAPRSKQCTS
jgi:hypothetical protein